MSKSAYDADRSNDSPLFLPFIYPGHGPDEAYGAQGARFGDICYLLEGLPGGPKDEERFLDCAG